MGVSIAISITQNSQSVANNTSNVTVKLKASWTYGSWNHTGQPNGWLKINGKSYSFSNVKLNPSKTTSGSQTLMTKELNIPHASDGTKTLSCSASFTTGLDNVGTITASASKKLTTIPRKSTLSVGNGTLNTSQTLTVTRKSTSFTHSIKAKCGTSALYIKADGTTSTSEVKHTDCSIPFKPPLSWASQNTTGVSVSVTYTITTYNGTTNVGSNEYTKTCSIPSSVKPSCTISVSDPTGHLATYGGYVKGKSKFAVTITPTKSYGSAIASYKATANGKTYTTASFTTGVISASGSSVPITATVTDKRGRTSSTATKKVLVHDYKPPSITRLAVGRCDEDGTPNDLGEYVKATFEISFTSLDNQNHVALVLRYKKSSDSTYTTPDDFHDHVADGYYIFAADTESSYDVKLSVTDDFETVSRSTSASTAFTLMHWKKNGKGMGIGKVSEDDDVLDVNFKIRARKGIEYTSEWVNLTLSPNFVCYEGNEKYHPQYKITGNTITIRGVVSPTSAYTPTNWQFKTIASGIPKEFVPPWEPRFVCQGTEMDRWQCAVTSSGNVAIARYGTTELTTVPATALLSFYVTYQI